MMKLAIALIASAALAGSAVAADLPARTYTKAPMMAMAPNWTGFYIFGGAGGGIWDADSNVVTQPGGTALTNDQRFGGDGWYGTVGAGYDWQFNSSWVAGIFADGQFGSLRGSATDTFTGETGRMKLNTSYAAGVRLGYLVAPNVFSYVNVGYTGPSGRAPPSTPRSAAPGLHHAFVPSKRLVRRRRRREQPEHLRHHGARLVHEDRVPRGLLRPRHPAGNLRRRPRTDGTPGPSSPGSDGQHLAGLSLQLERPGRREILIGNQHQETECPGIVRGFFVRSRRPACLAISLAVPASSLLPAPCRTCKPSA